MSRCVVLVSIALAACTGVHTAETHFARADDALAAGDLERVEKELGQGLRRAGNAWGRAMYERGRARMRLAKIAVELPALRARADGDIEVMRELRKRLAEVREAGGDPALQRSIDDELERRAQRVIGASERAAGDGAAAFGAALRELRAYQLPGPLDARAAKQLVRVAAIHNARAAAATTPLTRHAHAALAAFYDGRRSAPAPDGLLRPFRGSHEVRFTGAECSRLAAAAPPSGPVSERHVVIDIEAVTCELIDETKTAVDTVSWIEQGELLRVEEKVEAETTCGMRTIQIASIGYTCSSGAMAITCSNATQDITVPVCTTTKVVKKIPIYRQIPRTATREITTRTSKLNVYARVTARRGEHAVRSQISMQGRSSSRSAPAAGDMGPIAEGDYVPLDKLWGRHWYEVFSTFDSAMKSALQGDADRAVAAARANKASLDDQEEAWLRAVLYGASTSGIWRERYGIDAPQLSSTFLSTVREPFEVKALPAVAVFAIPPKPSDGPSEDSIRELGERRIPSLGRTFYLQGDALSLHVPATADPMDPGEETGALVGVRLGRALLTRRKRDRQHFGLKVVDEVAASAHLGARVAGADSGRLAYHAGASYALGLGFRSFRFGGLFAGLRPEATALKVGGPSATFYAVPAFARLEVPFKFGAIAVEGHGASLTGADQWGAAFHFATRGERYGKVAKYLTLRVDRITTDVAMTPADIWAVHVMFGAGGD